MILHGVQSHGGWYHGLGQTLSGLGYEVHFTDRRGSGANRQDRGHARSMRRLTNDVAEYLTMLRNQEPSVPLGLAGISWGGKLAVVAASEEPKLVDALALICPGLHPRVDVSSWERLRIAWAYFTFRPRKTFSIPLSDPALFTDNPDGQAFIARDPLGLKVATAGLLVASRWLDSQVAGVWGSIRQPALLMLADQDRIVNNEKTLRIWGWLRSTRTHLIRYPEGHHTLEFDPDPTQYARDLANWFDGELAVQPNPVEGRAV